MRDCHAEAKTKQTTYINKKRRPEPDYKVGEKAYLETKDLHLHIKQKYRSVKFYSRYVGPFEIMKSEPKTSNYTLKLSDDYQIQPKVHACRLNMLMITTLSSFLDMFLQNHPPATQMTISILLRLSWITVLCVGSVSFWFIGRVFRI